MATPSLGGSTLSSSDVLAYAQRVASRGYDSGLINMCQRFVREAFGSGPYGADTAVQAWRMARSKHNKGTPPPGTAVYWGGGAGHAAISAGNGWVYTTDFERPGTVSLARIDDITNKWGKPLLGWTDAVGTRKITRMDAAPVEGVGAGRYEPVYSGNGTNAGAAEGSYSKKELRERYGYIAEVYEGVPEIQRLVKMGVRARWTPEEFERRFEASRWYRNHTEEERQFVLNMATNPAETEQTIRQKKIDLQNLYRQLGIPVKAARLEEIATASIKHGWTQQQERNALVAEFDYNPKNTFGGVAGQTVDTLREMSASYLVPLSNKTLDQWTQNVLRGEATPEDFASYMRDQAKSLFPALAASIDKGVTVDQYLNPYRELAARELEVNPEDIDWTQPKWADLVFQTTKEGERGVMSLAAAQKVMRTDPRFRYDSTSQGRDAAATLATEMLSQMGNR